MSAELERIGVRARSLLAAYQTSAGEGPGRGEFTCCRCLRLAGADEGSDDLEGLCDDCWVEVDAWRGQLAAFGVKVQP